ncbi:MAG TPA: peptidylprolyl isomerase [Paracoccus sp. (in: a-proteobacteria)]|uniref:peptidylprolyl isomerase n=1 Tax=Paracoccus sp. TaxID=267 RepID=UPI002B6C29DC|nr:peptidylprolyl isomerase [Paracoccus sp. (in: a-proteobacteria)]HWL56672.1 peptidylprolyl isomerase [Paracoccus sp. (in: a-proteobacteria)]
MRRILLGAAMAAMLTGTQLAPGIGAHPAAAQSGGMFQPVVYVNDGAVTRFEIDQRMRFMEILHAPGADAASAEKALIDDRLRSFAAKQAGIRATEEQVNAGLEEFASRGNLTVDQFVQLLGQNGVERQTFEDFVVSGIVWRDFVRQRVVGQVRVTDAEVDEEMKKIIETPQTTHVGLSELIIPAPEGKEDEAMALAERIVSQTRSEADFAAFARQYSATPSAERGGRLPLTPLANLPPTLRPILLQLPPGTVSQPLTVQGAVVLFFMRETRGTLRPGATEQVLDYARLRLATAEEAAQIATLSDTCDDLTVQASRLPADRLLRQTLPQGQIPTGEAVRLAVLDDNETTIVNYGGTVDLLMLCKRSPALLANRPDAPVATSNEGDQSVPSDTLPARNDVRNQIYNRKVGEAAESYLAELRANAVIRRP